MLDRPAILIQRTTAPEQPRRIVAALLDAAGLAAAGGRVVVENHLNVCTAQEGAAVDAWALLAFLNSSAADQLYRCLTGSVAVSAFELSSLPAPPVDSLLAGRRSAPVHA